MPDKRAERCCIQVVHCPVLGGLLTRRSMRGNAVMFESCTIVSPQPMAVSDVPACSGICGLAAHRLESTVQAMSASCDGTACVVAPRGSRGAPSAPQEPRAELPGRLGAPRPGSRPAPMLMRLRWLPV